MYLIILSEILTPTQKTCNKKTVRKDWIEQLVVKKTMEIALSDDVIDRTADAILDLQKKENTFLPMLRAQMKEVEKSVNNMLNAIQQGVLTSSTKERLEELEKTKEELEISIMQEQLQKPMLTKDQIVFWISTFKKGDVTAPDFQQRLIDCFVNAVYLYDDRLVLIYNYKESTKTISLDEVEDAFNSKGAGSDLVDLAVPNKQSVIDTMAGCFIYMKSSEFKRLLHFCIKSDADFVCFIITCLHSCTLIIILCTPLKEPKRNN